MQNVITHEWREWYCRGSRCSPYYRGVRNNDRGIRKAEADCKWKRNNDTHPISSKYKGTRQYPLFVDTLAFAYKTN